MQPGSLFYLLNCVRESEFTFFRFRQSWVNNKSHYESHTQYSGHVLNQKDTMWLLTEVNEVPANLLSFQPALLSWVCPPTSWSAADVGPRANLSGWGAAEGGSWQNWARSCAPEGRGGEGRPCQQAGKQAHFTQRCPAQNVITCFYTGLETHSKYAGLKHGKMSVFGVMFVGCVWRNAP